MKAALVGSLRHRTSSSPWLDGWCTILPQLGLLQMRPPTTPVRSSWISVGSRVLAWRSCLQKLIGWWAVRSRQSESQRERLGRWERSFPTTTSPTLFQLAAHAANFPRWIEWIYSAYQWVHGRDHFSGDGLPDGMDPSKAFRRSAESSGSSKDSLWDREGQGEVQQVGQCSDEANYEVQPQVNWWCCGDRRLSLVEWKDRG